MAMNRSSPGARMRRVRVRAGLLVALLLGAAGPGVPALAGEGRVPSRTMDFTLAVAPFVSHGIGGSPHELTGFHLVPHLGLVVTEERGPGLLRGQLEVLAEPTLVHVGGDNPTDVLGLAVGTRWLFAGLGRVRPYVEAGAGVVTGQPRLPRNECEVLFSLQGGAGVLLFWTERHAVTLSYRFSHLSNGHVCVPNQGVNASMLVIGVTAFFD
jgi:hypothetical protein